mgnify:CR=1 FL=1
MLLRTVIAKETQSVYVNEISLFGLSNLPIPENVSQLYWDNNTSGWIVNNDGSQTKITEFPAWATQCVNIFNAALPQPDPTPDPTPEEINKEQASAELYATDWTSIPDITDPTKSNPILTNQAEFYAYRNQLRAIALNPPSKLVNLPVRPQAKWSA